jgi:hypothetical protein
MIEQSKYFMGKMVAVSRRNSRQQIKCLLPQTFRLRATSHASIITVEHIHVFIITERNPIGTIPTAIVDQAHCKIIRTATAEAYVDYILVQFMLNENREIQVKVYVVRLSDVALRAGGLLASTALSTSRFALLFATLS